jgi:hypothetical protein
LSCRSCTPPVSTHTADNTASPCSPPPSLLSSPATHARVQAAPVPKAAAPKAPKPKPPNPKPPNPNKGGKAPENTW